MHKPSSVLWDFDIQTDHLISARPSDLIIINKKERTYGIVDFAIPADPRIKLKESEKKDKYLAPCLGIEKTTEHESDNYTNRDWCFWYSHQSIIKGAKGLGNKKTSGNHPNYSIIEIGQNTEKSPGDLRRLAVIQTPVKDHQLTLMWKTLKE